MGVMDQKASLLLLCALSSSQVLSHAPGDGGEGSGEFWKRASEQVFKRSSNGDGTSDVLKPPFDRVVLELNRLEGMDTMKRGLASLIRPRFGKRNFSSFRMSNRVAGAKPSPVVKQCNQSLEQMFGHKDSTGEVTNMYLIQKQIS